MSAHIEATVAYLHAYDSYVEALVAMNAAGSEDQDALDALDVVAATAMRAAGAAEADMWEARYAHRAALASSLPVDVAAALLQDLQMDEEGQ